MAGEYIPQAMRTLDMPPSLFTCDKRISWITSKFTHTFGRRSNKRSLNGEVIDILERSLESKPVDVEALLDQVQRIQARLHLAPLTAQVLREAKSQGRP